jgi:hypothetical protein
MLVLAVHPVTVRLSRFELSLHGIERVGERSTASCNAIGLVYGRLAGAEHCLHEGHLCAVAVPVELAASARVVAAASVQSTSAEGF